MHNGELLSAISRAQLQGVLLKKHTAGPSGSVSKWAKRFFVIRDGFLLHYPEGERREFEKNHCLSLHPKGIVPLGFCNIQCISELGHPHALQITGTELSFPFVIAAETDTERERWLNALQQSSRITWNNAQLGDVMIKQLENQGLQMAKEKQTYVDKLQMEAIALHDEKLRADELARLNEELAKEREKLETLANDLSDEYEHIKQEIGETQAAMKSVEDSKSELLIATSELQTKLESLEKEKSQMLSQMQSPSRSNSTSDEQVPTPRSPTSTALLEQDLQNINEQTQTLLADKVAAEQRLQEFLDREHQLKEEKRLINEHAEQLKESLQELKTQKTVTEAELKEEVMARLAAERRLQEAEQRLARLERRIHDPGTVGEGLRADNRDEMIGDVKAIRRFFESLAAEAKLDAGKSVMMKNTVHARKVIVLRAQTKQYETLRKERETKTMSRQSVLEQFASMQSSP